MVLWLVACQNGQVVSGSKRQCAFGASMRSARRGCEI